MEGQIARTPSATGRAAAVEFRAALPVHTVAFMRFVPTWALLAAVLLPLGAARAAGDRPLEVRAALAESRIIERALRPLPRVLGRPGPYALLERWVDAVARPPPDGTARLVVVPVSGGLGLAWARRW